MKVLSEGGKNYTENLEGGKEDENKQTIIDVIEHKRGTCFVHFLATNIAWLESSVSTEGSAGAKEKLFVVVLVGADKHTKCVKSHIILHLHFTTENV